MTERQHWLQTLKPNNLVLESSHAGQRTVRIQKIERGKIFYHNAYTNVEELRFVHHVTGASSDYARHLLPLNADSGLITTI